MDRDKVRIKGSGCGALPAITGCVVLVSSLLPIPEKVRTAISLLGVSMAEARSVELIVPSFNGRICVLLQLIRRGDDWMELILFCSRCESDRGVFENSHRRAAPFRGSAFIVDN